MHKNVQILTCDWLIIVGVERGIFPVVLHDCGLHDRSVHAISMVLDDVISPPCVQILQRLLPAFCFVETNSPSYSQLSPFFLRLVTFSRELPADQQVPFRRFHLRWNILF